MTQRKTYIDVLTVISCAAVVFLHVNDAFWTFSYQPYWVGANIIETICYFAVPVFFMITGATLMDFRKRYTLKEYFRKRVVRTVIPFLIWSLVALAWQIWRGRIAVADLTPLGVVNSIVNTEYLGIYWFFIALFAIYLSIPVLSLIPEDKRKEAFGYLIIVGALANFGLPFISKVTHDRLVFPPELTFPMAAFYLIYPLIGYYLDRYTLSSRARWAIYLAGTAGFVVHLVGTWVLSYAVGGVDRTFKGYLNVPPLLHAVAVFTFLRYHAPKSAESALLKVVTFFKSTTYGVYLIHWFCFDVAVNTLGFSRLSLSFRLIGGLVIFLVSALIIKAVQRIPGAGYIVP